MSAIRETGKINDNTFLIDIGMMGVAGVTAMYLIEDEKKCLIDGGTRTEAKRIINILKEMNAFPPDIIIITHSHWDHTQAIPTLRREAARQGKIIEVLASEAAIPLLADQSYNDVFGSGPYENITDVKALNEGDVVELGKANLHIYEVPGHHQDHIAILDGTTKNMFVGDSIGYKIGDNTFLPPFMPPFWDMELFRETINRYRQVDYESLCLAHFGYIYGDEARTVLDEAVATCDTWWQAYDRNADRLDDIDHMMNVVFNEIQPTPVHPEIISTKLKILASVMTTVTKVLRKEPVPLFNHLMKGFVEWLGKGYKTYKDQAV
jgi:glyoxylase-like metal-dependent hydrolase (beta-lactamase superfamily II)